VASIVAIGNNNNFLLPNLHCFGGRSLIRHLSRPAAAPNALQRAHIILLFYIVLPIYAHIYLPIMLCVPTYYNTYIVYELTYSMYFEIYFPDKDVRLPSSPPSFAARIYIYICNVYSIIIVLLSERALILCLYLLLYIILYTSYAALFRLRIKKSTPVHVRIYLT